MDWLNYHHLFYFWTVAREGSIAAASRTLHLTPQTVSAQIRTLEENFGQDLFERRNRRLYLTDTGRFVQAYADDIFSLGRDLVDALRKRPNGRPVKLVVGVVDGMPKSVVHRLLRPALTIEPAVHLVVKDGPPEQLLADLAIHRLDVVLSDAPIPPTVKIKAYNHQLGASGVAILAAPSLAITLGADFPACLTDAPMVLPTEDTTLRRALEHFFKRHAVTPQIVAEVADSALALVFGHNAVGAFAVPELVADALCDQHGLQRIGSVDGHLEQLYAITVERRITHPAIIAISEGAMNAAHSGVSPNERE
jgi:LysR family transcriptional activator of nhaA